jgi:two-component system cell cycle sensor histidine kinase/response regulator CckA
MVACAQVEHSGDIPLEQLSEARLRELVAHLPFFAVMIDREHRYIWINKLDQTLELGHVIGQTFESFIHPSCKQMAFDAIERAFESKEATYYEARGYADGELENWFGIRTVPLPADELGRVRALVLSTDVTTRRQAEAALRESEARFRLLTEASPDYVLVIDHERRCEYVNRIPSDEDIPASALLGRPVDEIVMPAEREIVTDQIQNVLQTGCSASLEVHGPGSARPYVIRILPLPSVNDLPRALIVVTDVSEQRAAEAHRRQLEGRLAQAQKMESIGQLAGGIAHDFNNMIMVMGLHLEAARELARTGELEGTRRELDQIEIASKRAADLTRQLLAFARRQPHQPRAMLGAELASSSMRLLSRLIPASIRLELEIRAPEAWVMVDAALIEQAIMNLCVNARDAIGDGRGTISVVVDRREIGEPPAPIPPQVPVPAGRWVTLSVADTGHGIAEGDLPRIFEPFFTTKPTGKGTGLGLSMVHGIVTQHQGIVTVDSRVGEGSVLTVYLPEVVAVAASARSDSARASSPERARVLVAEDEPMVRKLVAKLLRGAGHAVVEAENGLQALEIVQASAEQFDLLVLDAVMPEMSGKECYERIHELYPKLPAIFSSGYTGDLLPSAFMREHGLKLIAKPYDSKTLLETVDQVVRESRSRKTRSAS